jgi:hypothetical protein
VYVVIRIRWGLENSKQQQNSERTENEQCRSSVKFTFCVYDEPFSVYLFATQKTLLIFLCFFVYLFFSHYLVCINDFFCCRIYCKKFSSIHIQQLVSKSAEFFPINFASVSHLTCLEVS